MIRYVVAVILMTALLSIGMAGAEYAGTVRSEQQLENQVSILEKRAVSLVETETATPRDQDGARRILEIDLPSDGLASESVEVFTIQPDVYEGTLVTYRFAGRTTRTEHIEVTLRNPNNPSGLLDLSGETKDVTLVLTLEEQNMGRGEYVAIRVKTGDRKPGL